VVQDATDVCQGKHRLIDILLFNHSPPQNDGKFTIKIRNLITALIKMAQIAADIIDRLTFDRSQRPSRPSFGTADDLRRTANVVRTFGIYTIYGCLPHPHPSMTLNLDLSFAERHQGQVNPSGS
jgi:hypothetical protein